MFQTKEQDKILGRTKQIGDLSNLSDKEVKVMVIGLRERMDEYSGNFNKEKENIKKNQSGLKNTITNKKYTKGINSRLENAEKWISDLEDRVLEITQKIFKK